MCCAGEEHYVQVGAAAANHLNPMGRASLTKVDPHTLSRASIIKVWLSPKLTHKDKFGA